MNTKTNTNRGSTLLVTIVILALVSTVLAAYVTLSATGFRLATRSQTWNSCMPVAEAGIEDALSHLNFNMTNGLAVDGWTKTAGLYWMRRPINDGYYIVTISNFSLGTPNVPVIEARAYCLYTPDTFLSRGVRVTTKPLYRFNKAILVKTSVGISGNNVMIDSFDSSNPLYSTNGLYIASKHRANGNVFVNASGNVLNIGNANIFGSISAGAGTAPNIGPQGVVGDLAWHQSHKGIQPGYFKTDANITITDVQVPFVGGFSPDTGGGWITNAAGVGTHYDYILNSGNYSGSTLNGSVYINGDVNLYISSTLNMTALHIDGDKIFNLYTAATDASVVGNDNGNAASFSYFGLPSNKTLTMNGNGTISGTVYAPECAITLHGGGSDNIDFVGAIVAASLDANGHFSLHFDEALSNAGAVGSHIVNSWNEMTPQEISALPVSVGQ